MKGWVFDVRETVLQEIRFLMYAKPQLLMYTKPYCNRNRTGSRFIKGKTLPFER